MAEVVVAVVLGMVLGAVDAASAFVIPIATAPVPASAATARPTLLRSTGLLVWLAPTGGRSGG
jgi:hypothetical protein